MMKLEEAIIYLKAGNKIYRESKPDDYLEGTIEEPLGSFYLSLWDILAEDWMVDATHCLTCKNEHVACVCLGDEND